MSKVVALSGGIGSGKTTVREILAELGATTVCADAIVHAIQVPGTGILETIAEAFGPEVIDVDASSPTPRHGPAWGPSCIPRSWLKWLARPTRACNRAAHWW